MVRLVGSCEQGTLPKTGWSVVSKQLTVDTCGFCYGEDSDVVEIEHAVEHVRVKGCVYCIQDRFIIEKTHRVHMRALQRNARYQSKFRALLQWLRKNSDYVRMHPTLSTTLDYLQCGVRFPPEQLRRTWNVIRKFSACRRSERGAQWFSHLKWFRDKMPEPSGMWLTIYRMYVDDADDSYPKHSIIERVQEHVENSDTDMVTISIADTMANVMQDHDDTPSKPQSTSTDLMSSTSLPTSVATKKNEEEKEERRGIVKGSHASQTLKKRRKKASDGSFVAPVARLQIRTRTKPETNTIHVRKRTKKEAGKLF